MKKILIALPLVLVMLLSMIPVMAVEVPEKPETVRVSVQAYYYEQPDSAGFKTKRIEDKWVDVKIAEDAKKLEAYAKEIVEKWEMPHDKTTWEVETWKIQPYKHNEKVITEEQVPNYIKIDTFLEENKNVKKPEAGLGEAEYIKAGFQIPDTASVAEPYELEAGDVTADQKDAMFVLETKVTETVTDATEAFASFTVKPNCKTEKDKEPKCVVLCSEITVQLRDVHNGKFLDDYKQVIEVNPNEAPDYQAVIKLYMDKLFPWAKYQPLKNYLNVYSILTPKNLEDCEIIIDVLPKYEKIQIIHELYDCCITPEGEVKKDLFMSFIEDNEAFVKTGVPDGFMNIPFLEFHTGLMVNQEKAAEYAKTRLEKINAKDFVFQDATFYDGINASAYVKGVKDLKTGKVTPIKNDVPTIVVRYLRGECVKTDEKVDNAKVEAGVQTTTNAPAQQLPATGAKDITAFFMSAVALLGLGIFFAKKH